MSIAVKMPLMVSKAYQVRVWPFRLSLHLVLLFICLASSQANQPSDSVAIEFFESKIRPVLVENCYECHSSQAGKTKGSLSLDSREGLLKGGDSGPAIVPGDPERSLVIKAVRYVDESLQMPPKNKKLTSEQIADLESWVKMGAPDPRDGKTLAASETVQEKTKKHWAFQPVTKPAIPIVEKKEWIQSPVDAFILAKLEQEKMTPSAKADKRTLIRRVTFDLTGLPPSTEEVEAFLADQSSEAFARVVDRLLSSPRYGEKWARHWLDVARYADTKGYVFEEERRYPYSYTYRDYVIQSFNEDLPFDRFIIEQIAADLLSLGEDKRALAALGYLTLGRRFLNNPHDIIDDRIDVVTRGMMGLTVACARCHDHKYDPISIKDYYSLYGVFASTSEPAEKPLLGSGTQPPEYNAYLEERKKRQDELNTFRETKRAESLSEVRLKSADYLVTAYETSKNTDQSNLERIARERKLHPDTARRWSKTISQWATQTNHPVFGPWAAFASIPESEFAARSKELAFKLATETSTNRLNPFVARAFSGSAPESMTKVAERYGTVLADIEKQWQETLKNHKAVAGESGKSLSGFADSSMEELRQVLYAEGSPANVPEGEIPRLFDVPSGQKVRALQRKIEELDATHPGAPPRAMALQDNAAPHTPRVFVRGNPNNPGPEVPRQFLEVVSKQNRKPFEKGSGRLELAQAIATPENPLTARVIVNRIWMQYFGAGLVRTPSDFGLRCEPPSHPELLDYLASYFIAEGWSLKKLHRLIVLSSVYQQTSDLNPEYAQRDPNNLLLWKMNRRRLDLESMRDTLLAVGGNINLSTGGRPVEITSSPFSARRTVYGFIERQNLPAMFRTFDFASPDTTSPQRFATTVPQQGLFMMNSPFVVQQARQFAKKVEAQSALSEVERVKLLYRTAYQRDPSEEEMNLAADFLKTQSTLPPKSLPSPAWQYGYGEYDAESKRTKQFRALSHFTGQAWQGGSKLPDDRLGWVTLNATGGHPGNDLKHAAIRRWTAPNAAVVDIQGVLAHETDKGDGVRGRIVSNRKGELGTWIAHNGKQQTNLEKLEIEKGETIDFIADCNEGVDNDSFAWSPGIKVVEFKSGEQNTVTVWNAKDDFGGPKELPAPLNSWEKYAQVLLMSNELVFLD